MTCDDLDGRHIDRVDVRSLLTVDLDADEMIVEKLGNFLVGERLVLHNVTPMATRIADGEKNRLVFPLRLFQGPAAPRVPLDWIRRVLEQIRTGLARQPIHLRRAAIGFGTHNGHLTYLHKAS